jgi:hypothetical protein
MRSHPPFHSLDNVVILAQLLEQTDLSDRRARHALVLRLETNLLERHDVPGGDVPRFVDHAVGAYERGGAESAQLEPGVFCFETRQSV